jgi:hypothetical protein
MRLKGDRPNPDLLEARAPLVLRSLRRSVAEVLGELPRCDTAVELASRLNLDRSLAWKVWRVAQGQHEYPSPKHIPGKLGIERFFEAAQAGGVSSTVLTAARDAYAAFDQLARKHAGDRASADIMLAAMTAEGRPRLEVALRRDGFRANSHFLGMQTHALYQCCVVLPGQRHTMPGIALLKGYFGLRRMRGENRLLIARSQLIQQRGPTANYRRTPLADGGRGNADRTPLVARFCSRPLPDIRRTRVSQFVVEDTLPPGPIGEAGAVDLVTAELFDEIQRDEVDRDAVTARVSIPCERFCFDVFIHKTVAAARPPILDVFSTMHGEGPFLRPDAGDRMQLPESLQHLGNAATAAPASETPHWVDLIAWLFGRLSAAPADFELFRLQMRFPPIPICAAVTYGLHSEP